MSSPSSPPPGCPSRCTPDGLAEPLLDAAGNPSAVTYDCHVCHQPYERPDLTACLTHDTVVCSLCLSTDKLGDHVLPATV